MAPYSKKVQDELYVSPGFLEDNGFNRGTLANNLTRYRQGKSATFAFHKDPVDGTRWILYGSIPLSNLCKMDLPKTGAELEGILNDALPALQEPALSYTERWFRDCWYQWGWVRFYPEYTAYLFGRKVQTLFAKTHYIIELIIRLKRHDQFPLKELYLAYMRMPNVVFKTRSYKYFSAKIRKCELQGTARTLVHGFRVNGRKPYKVTTELSKLIRNYAYSPIRHSISEIYRLVNRELTDKDMPNVSESTVRRICTDTELVNRSLLMRLGAAYAENHLLPYMDRENVKNVGDLYVIDSTRLNFPYRSEGPTQYLWLCAMIDANSRKIVGHSFGPSESMEIVNACLKSAFSKNHIIPLHILCDNHGCFKGNEFKVLRSKLIDYGVNVRRARKRNPKDKGHIESWFGTLQEKYLSGRVGFLGEGIRTRKKGGRAGREMEQLIRSEEWSVTREQLVGYVEEDIQNYNEDFHGTLKGVPATIYRTARKDMKRVFRRHDISLLFGTLKKIKVKNGKIRFWHLKRKYTYQIWDTGLLNKLNGTSVTVRFHEPDLSEISVFDEHEKYQCDLLMEVRVSPVPYNNEEMKVIQDFHLKKVGFIRDNLKSIYDDMVVEGEEAIPLPYVSLDEVQIQKINAVKSLDRKLMENTFRRYGLATLADGLAGNGDNDRPGGFVFYSPKTRKKLDFKRIPDGWTAEKKEV